MESPTMMAEQDGRNRGLGDAAAFLEGTADDYEQLAAQRDKTMGPETFGFGEAKRQTRELREKAALLRGQAGHIRAMRK